MKKVTLILSLFITFFITGALAYPAAAASFDPNSKLCQTDGAQSSTFCHEASKTDNTLTGSNGVIIKGANILSFITGVAAVIIIIVAGMQYILSSGDPSRLNNARNMIIYALIGLAIVGSAQLIIRFIIGRL